MADIERAQVIQNLLFKLRGIETLKRLFWTELNYERVNKTLSRKDWPKAASDALAEDPVLFAKGGEQFEIICSRLSSDKLLLVSERSVIARLLQDHPYALFIFSNSLQDHWHFVNVKYEEDAERRRVLRRFTIGPEERLRTASERLQSISLEGLPSLAPNSIQQLHDQAFDVEPVTREFFIEYGRIFDEVEASIKGLQDKERKRLFTQKLFNRVMFIAFIQKKGWLKFDRNSDYLTALWKSHRNEKTSDKNFYRDRLKPLFFFGLNGGAQETDVANINRGGFLSALIGEVPYLNGGLFEEDEEDRSSKIIVPDKAIDLVLNGLFAKFNFTVTESTPLDVEVAVDPEMLGKIFEELVTGRHETGSYYTPKPIVSFMCREALKGYLQAQLPTEQARAIAEFVDQHNPMGLRDAELVLEALRRVTVCDPACGSGAYLVGMLHELLELRGCLFANNKLDATSAYDRKLEIISRNLYGVDLDQFAVNIARLRLWLSLSVDYEGLHPPPLPNLDFKVESGDTVCSPTPSGLQLGLQKSLVDQFLSLKAGYMTVHYGRKVELKKNIIGVRKDVATWAHRGGGDFDWPIDFAEVFIHGGFDIALANPPYVRQELIKDLKPTLARIFPGVYSGVADLYCYFYARSIELLKEGGMLAFISSNKWLRAGYGAGLRKYVAGSCAIRSITDFGELPVFESAATFPMICIAQKEVTQASFVFTQVKSLDPPYPDIRELVESNGKELESSSLNGSDWNMASGIAAVLVKRMRGHQMTLREYVRGKIFYGVKTGFNDAFVLTGKERKRLIEADPTSSEIIKPLAIGDDVRKWRIRFKDRWLIFARRGIDIDLYPAVREHLSHWRADLEPRPLNWPKGKDWSGRKPGHYKWYEIQDDVAYFRSFEKHKIVYPIIAKESRFAYDAESLFTNDKSFIIPTDDLFLLGILNSSVVWQYLKSVCSVLGDPEEGGRLELRRIYLEKLPIPAVTDAEKAKMISLVRWCLEEPKSAYEDSINEFAARLYGVEAIFNTTELLKVAETSSGSAML